MTKLTATSIAMLFSATLAFATNVIVQEHHTELRVIAAGKAEWKETETRLILNKGGMEASKQVYSYDAFQKIKSITVTIYTSAGKEIKTYKLKDFKDISAQDGFTLYSDNRVKFLNIAQYAPPIVVKTSIEKQLDGLLFYPTWLPANEFEVGVQGASFHFECPIALKPTFYTNNLPEPDTSISKGIFSADWHLIDFEPITYEKLMPNPIDYLPELVVEPRDFEIDGNVGNMDTWQSFGNWINELYEPRMALPKELKAYIDAHIKPINNPYQRAKAVFEFLQSRYRYVSIQFGMGSWQPISADDVYQTGYGDCKALSNYTVSMLRYAGIEAYYLLVRAGMRARTLEDNPTARFNHVIACALIAGDTIWMECTSNTLPFGYLGSFTGCRKALLIKENSSHLVATPCSEAEMHISLRKSNISLSDDKGTLISGNMHLLGLYFDEYEHNISLNTHDLKKEFYQEFNPIWSVNFEQIDFEITDSLPPTARFTFSGQVLNYEKYLGKRLMAPVFPYQNEIPNIQSDSTRIYPIELKSTFRQTDSLYFQCPENYKIATLFDDISVSTPIGSYLLSASATKNGVLIYREVQLKKGIFPADFIKHFSILHKTQTKGDATKIIFEPI